ncbi:protein FAR1-RELATED SEQUENCE 5-like isoform X2 [Phragmites australis]|uniref:protein FAR1-RELATED SEQUENCE 5-like isoform X2 n=1 Tax=Phragmites australis TaxID=29695 RepID=UPI002D792D19|nr:protein FAR1-RELATED SEQUENCE 5-like isoform X2 [Phragmites australis]
MEGTSIAIEIDGEAICLDSVGDNEHEAQENGEMQQIIYNAGGGEQVAFDSQEQGREEDPAGNEEEDRENNSIIPSREELTEELRNKVAYSEEEAYRLYCDYGHRMGFSVRKGKQYYFTGTKTIRTKDYYCSKEGMKDDEQLTEANFNKPETRTNCKAMVRFRVDSEGQWRVIQIIPEHNHELVRPEEVHLLRSVRTLSVPKPGALNAMVNAEIQAMHDSLHINEDGTECHSQLSIRSYTLLEPEDSEALVGYFKRRTNEQGMFYWDVEVDQEGRMTNFFWRDGRSRLDYDSFGDVVIFDTAYRTSKYNMICAPFVGVNHHWQNVMFGCAFLLDESSTSYEWLFKSFLESMGGRPPKTIFTDQNESISKAIEDVLPGTRHCLCQWYIEKNLQSHLGTINASGTFHSMLSKCMKECESEAEFNEAWAMMHHEYNMQEHQWLTDLYQQRHKWCTALHKDAFDGGIESLDRSESSNNVLRSISDISTSLATFILEFDKIVGSWRKNESLEDIRCNQTAPECTVKHSRILQQAAEVYTHNVYKSLETDFLDGCGATSYQEVQCSEALYRFEFILQRSGPKVWIVFLNTSTMDLSCSCKKFETMGILCSHALNALGLKNIDRIPERYILKRWTKYVRKGTYPFPVDEFAEQDRTKAEFAYRNRAMWFVYDLLMKSKSHHNTRKLILDVLENGEKSLGNVCELKRLHIHPSGKEKDGSRVEKRKKKSIKPEKHSRNVKQVVLPQPADLVFVDPPNQDQYYAAEDIASNSSIGRPFFYQGYPTTGVSASQIQGHTNMQSVPQCASQTLQQNNKVGYGNRAIYDVVSYVGLVSRDPRLF